MREREIEQLQAMRSAVDSGKSTLVSQPTTACCNAALYPVGIQGVNCLAELIVFHALTADGTVKEDMVSYFAMGSVIWKLRFYAVKMGVVKDVFEALVDVVSEVGVDCDESNAKRVDFVEVCKPQSKT